MSVNPNGYVPVTDGGAPRIITGYATETISGGQFLGASGAAGVVDSGLSSYATTDITVHLTTGSGNFIGIALADATSGNQVAIATRGSFIVSASGEKNVLAGKLVRVGTDSEVIIGSGGFAAGEGEGHIGRAWTTGSGGEFIIVDIHG